MMPEVGRVLDAARLVLRYDTDGLGELRDAMAALDAKLANAGKEPTREEHERAWGEVVAGDEILSTKTGRWYEVTRTVKDGTGNVKLNIKGSPKPITRPVNERTPIRRGVLGEGTDILETLWSAQTRPDEIVSKDTDGPLEGGDEA